MGLFKRSRAEDPFETWVENASHEELSDAYEERRLQWIKDGCGGDGEITPEMKRINSEINERVAEEVKNDPNRRPGYHWTDANRWEKD